MNRIATKPKLSERAMRQPALYTVYGFMAFFILIAITEFVCTFVGAAFDVGSLG